MTNRGPGSLFRFTLLSLALVAVFDCWLALRTGTDYVAPILPCWTMIFGPFNNLLIYQPFFGHWPSFAEILITIGMAAIPLTLISLPLIRDNRWTRSLFLVTLLVWNTFGLMLLYIGI